jgi:hypothetical protein
MKKIKAGISKVVEFDKRLIAKAQKKFGLSDYQVVCLSFVKGVIIGAIIL